MNDRGKGENQQFGDKLIDDTNTVSKNGYFSVDQSKAG